MELYKTYELKNGDKIVFDGVSFGEYSKLDIYTSKQYHGAWDKKGRFLTNVHFLEEPSEMDVLK